MIWGVIMSCLPYWIEVLKGFSVPAIALLAAGIGYFQWRTAQQKVVLDLFDRRLDTYTALRNVVSKIMASSNAATNETSFEFLKALGRAEFLFGPEVIEHLKKIDLAISDIRIAIDERRDLPSGPSLQANVRTERAARQIVASFYTTFQPLVTHTSGWIKSCPRVLRTIFILW
jgi:hypothetical protein